MTKTTLLYTPYFLPFKVFVTEPPLMSVPSKVIVRFASELNDITIQKAQETLNVFVKACQAGAMAGDSYEPLRSSAQIVGSPQIFKDEIVWELNPVNIDELSVIILIHMFGSFAYHIQPIISLTLQPRGRISSLIPFRHIEGERVTHPRAYAKLPFKLNKEWVPAPGSVTFVANFEKELSDDFLSKLRSALLAWARVAQYGGYAGPPLELHKSYIIPEEDFRLLGSEVEWGLQKIFTPESCIDGLINVFVAFHYRVLPLIDLFIG